MKKLIFIFCFTLIGCNHDPPKGFYKYYDGYHIGDFLELPSDNYQIKNDTLFKLEKPVAKFIGIKNRIDGNVILKIRSLEKNEKGMYIKK